MSRDDLSEIVPVLVYRLQILSAIDVLKSGKVFPCFKCELGFISFQKLLDHFKDHSLAGNSIYKCLHCDSQLDRKNYLRHMRNIYKFHPNILQKDRFVKVDQADNYHLTPEICSVNENIKNKNNDNIKDLKIIWSQILASILKSGKVPMSTCDNVFSNIKRFVNKLLLLTSKIAQEIVKTSKPEEDKISIIHEEFLHLMTAFKPFESKFKLDKFMLENNFMIPAREIILDSDITFRQNNSVSRQVYRPISMQYVSITASIKQLLHKPGFYSSLDQSGFFNSEFFSNFREGRHSQSFPFPKNTIFINLYYD